MSETRTILIVDGHPDIRLMCRVNLQLEGYVVFDAPDGEAGLAAAREMRPDLVLLDTMMPGLDGWQVFEAMKADPDLASTPVVLLTARTQRRDEVRRWTAGAADHLAKPFNPSTLADVVRRALSERGTGERRRRALEKSSIL